MNQEAIQLVKRNIKECEDLKSKLESRICLLKNQIQEASKQLFQVNNVKQSLEAGLESLEEAVEKDKAILKLEEEIKASKEETEEEIQRKLERGDKAIEAAQAEQKKGKKEEWEVCPQCNENKVAPWNEKGICSSCQRSSKGKRKYTRRKEENNFHLDF